ncbi:MAG TPA: hypothetical protein VHW47_05835, partial [Acidimicrobiales bacterium]|nr:hypothetical protein [Acidimicrobiales bacterium]
MPSGTSVVETVASRREPAPSRPAPDPPSDPRRPAPAWPAALAVAVYTLLAVLVWIHVWTGDPRAVASCGCGDPALTTWFLEWPAYALAHWANPLYSTALFHPAGVNLLSNTGFLAIGVPLAPITWLAGPVATLNVAATLLPVASATAAYFLVARWSSWAPAAFVGGLLYGFSPFLLDNLAGGHLNLAGLFVLPLLVGQLDELFVRQRARPARTGALLALLAVVQFFLSTEMLVVTAIAAVVGLAVLAAIGVVRGPPDVARRLRRARPGMVTAVVATVAVLAYPTWFALWGPAHLSGAVWPASTGLDQYTPTDLLAPFPGAWWGNTLKLWGYFGPVLPSEVFCGLGTVAVALAGLAVWRRDLRLWLFGIVGLVTAALAMGTGGQPWAPWRLFGSLPLLENVIQSRFIVVTYLCLAVMVGVTLDRVHTALRQRPEGRSPAAHHRPGHHQAVHH